MVLRKVVRLMKKPVKQIPSKHHQKKKLLSKPIFTVFFCKRLSATIKTLNLKKY